MKVCANFWRNFEAMNAAFEGLQKGGKPFKTKRQVWMTVPRTNCHDCCELVAPAVFLTVAMFLAELWLLDTACRQICPPAQVGDISKNVSDTVKKKHLTHGKWSMTSKLHCSQPG